MVAVSLRCEYVRRMRWFVACLVVLGCGASGAPSTTTPAPSAASAPVETTPAPAAPPSGSAAATTGAEVEPSPDQSPRARVVSAEIVTKDQYYKRATLAFENPSPYTCTVASYRVTWPGGKKDISLETFTVPPRETRQRSVRMHN